MSNVFTGPGTLGSPWFITVVGFLALALHNQLKLPTCVHERRQSSPVLLLSTLKELVCLLKDTFGPPPAPKPERTCLACGHSLTLDCFETDSLCILCDTPSTRRQFKATPYRFDLDTQNYAFMDDYMLHKLLAMLKPRAEHPQTNWEKEKAGLHVLRIKQELTGRRATRFHA